MFSCEREQDKLGKRERKSERKDVCGVCVCVFVECFVPLLLSTKAS